MPILSVHIVHVKFPVQFRSDVVHDTYCSTAHCLLFATKFHSREVDSSQFITVDEVHSLVAVQECLGTRCSYVYMPCKFSAVHLQKEKKLLVFMTSASIFWNRLPFTVRVGYRTRDYRLLPRGKVLGWDKGAPNSNGVDQSADH